MVLLSPSIQPTIVHANSPYDNWPHRNKLALIMRYNCHPTLLRHALSGIQPLNDLLFHYLLHGWIQPSLVLNAWIVIWHEFDFVEKNAALIQICFHYHRQSVISTQEHIPQMRW